MSARPLNPTAMLATLSECGVDFVVIGALAVGVYGEVRGTGDVDVMVPVDDEANTHALEKALDRLDATRIPPLAGGDEQGSDADYPMVMFNTRFGRLDILYDLTGQQLELWAQALAERLHGSDVLADPSADVWIGEP